RASTISRTCSAAARLSRASSSRARFSTSWNQALATAASVLMACASRSWRVAFRLAEAACTAVRLRPQKSTSWLALRVAPKLLPVLWPSPPLRRPLALPSRLGSRLAPLWRSCASACSRRVAALARSRLPVRARSIRSASCGCWYSCHHSGLGQTLASMLVFHCAVACTALCGHGVERLQQASRARRIARERLYLVRSEGPHWIKMRCLVGRDEAEDQTGREGAAEGQQHRAGSELDRSAEVLQQAGKAQSA